MIKSNRVFTPKKINELEIPNRLVRSATTELMADVDGYVTDSIIKYYKELAAGGIGLTISAVANIREDGKQIGKMLAIYTDDYLEGLTNLAGNYHDTAQDLGNQSRIFLQIGHCGAQLGTGGWEGKIIGPSEINSKISHKTSKALSIDEIKEVINQYALAIKRAKDAGFDGIQLHGSHGYLINQFYSPYFNKRIDEYGGSTQNRAKFAIEIIKEARKRVGNSFPITMKMNGSDMIEGGLTVDEAARLAVLFAKNGYDALEISSYIMEVALLENPVSLPPEAQINLKKRKLEAYNLKRAKTIKEDLSKEISADYPLMLVGGLYRFETIADIIKNHNIDFCAMCRPIICQPNLPNIWRKGPPYSEAECIFCNQCSKELIKGRRSKGIRCIYKEKLDKSKRR